MNVSVLMSMIRNIKFALDNLDHYKCPKAIPIPKYMTVVSQKVPDTSLHTITTSNKELFHRKKCRAHGRKQLSVITLDNRDYHAHIFALRIIRQVF